MVVSTLNDPWFVVLAKTARAEAKRRGYTATIFDSQNDPAKEAAHFENLVAAGYRAVLFDATDAKGSVPNALRAARRHAGLHHGPGNRLEGGRRIAGDIGQLCRGGAFGGCFIQQLESSGRYVELLGLVGDNNTWNRSRGFHSVVDRYPDLKMVAQQSAEFDRSRALEIMESILQAQPDIEAVFCGNDAMALGAYQALLGAGRAQTVKVFGFDGSADAIKSIAAEKLSATAMQYPQVMAATAAEFPDRYLRGERGLPRRLRLPWTW